MDDKNVRVGVGVMILKNNKILLGKRNETNSRGGGSWTCPGGNVEFKEKLIDAIKRETEEETSIKINDARIVSVSGNNDYGNHYITLGFVCEDFDGQPKVMEPNKIIEWKWFSIEDLPKPMFIPSERLINNFREGKIYKGD